PQNLENELKVDPVISQVLVVGDRRPYVAALVTVDPDQAKALSSDELHSTVQIAIDRVNADRSRYEQIKRFAVLPREFSLEHDEVAPTLRLRRKVILDHFAAEVEELYG